MDFSYTFYFYISILYAVQLKNFLQSEGAWETDTTGRAHNVKYLSKKFLG